MQRRTHPALLTGALLLVGCPRAPEPTSSPDPAPAPPSTFVESEPNHVDAPTPGRLTIIVTDGLAIAMHAKPLLLDGDGWGFEIELEFRNQLETQGVFDLGPEPVVVFTISVTLPDGSGYGSGGGCAFGSNLHGHEEQELWPGERRTLRDQWAAGVDAQQVLEAGISLCRVRLPDGRAIGGTIAQLVATVDAEGKLTQFELRAATVLPRPEP